MISPLSTDKTSSDSWISAYFVDFRRRILKLFGKSFNTFSSSMALSLIDNPTATKSAQVEKLTNITINEFFLPHDIQRLEAYARNQVEYRLILDLTTDLGMLYFQNRLDGIDAMQKAILLAVGLQNKTVDTVAEELNMPPNQILAKFYNAIKKLTKQIVEVMENKVEEEMTTREVKDDSQFEPLKQSLDEELTTAANELQVKQKKELSRLKRENLTQYAIKGTDEEWGKALTANKSSIISVKSGEKRLGDSDGLPREFEEPTKKKKKKFKKSLA